VSRELGVNGQTTDGRTTYLIHNASAADSSMAEAKQLSLGAKLSVGLPPRTTDGWP